MLHISSVRVGLTATILTLYLATGAFAQNKSVVSCTDPRVLDKLPSNCKREMVSADGPGRPFGIGAQGAAMTAWQREVQRKFGNAYVTWENSVCHTLSPTPGGIGIGEKVLKRYTAAGFPCTPSPTSTSVFETTEANKPLTVPQVKELQQGLVKLGFKLGKKGPDGTFGSDTRKALQSWQRSRGLTTIDDEVLPDISVLEAVRKAVKPG